MSKLWGTIIAVFTALLGIIGFLFIKKQSAEALLQNQETKEKLNNLDSEINKNKANEDYESLKRNLINKTNEERKNEAVKPSDFN